ncbi:hypothetical protein GCM10011574_38230 [Microbispora bryophytorum]|uniref:Uncharacterized protein n=1 Tax=Microbispora bryophytorum TaxID=1460882 RepID=A0A8H9LED2_9ACTN|nr:hypothetical protein GCM10011574_38230 [Microbispora bryophytorum]
MPPRGAPEQVRERLAAGEGDIRRGGGHERLQHLNRGIFWISLVRTDRRGERAAPGPLCDGQVRDGPRCDGPRYDSPGRRGTPRVPHPRTVTAPTGADRSRPVPPGPTGAAGPW